jgi:hypothetical protein
MTAPNIARTAVSPRQNGISAVPLAIELIDDANGSCRLLLHDGRGGSRAARSAQTMEDRRGQDGEIGVGSSALPMSELVSAR